ncbi:FxsB family cyclophane-forming radical SAM/SPASM peptide maturase [Streptomyces griseoaurantiacus]|uniref:FxsB family cyclophane-forming radical SAM/SPASM peptide maturase n=1 Tax=Streptomyces griseoaurantiacus TaxID=68213 RepID=UPI0036314AEA
MTAATGSFRQFVIKVHSRCDLRCDHCYVYTHADRSWRGRPVTMSEDTLRLAAARIAEHAVAHRLPRVHVVLHGGEPLLAGRERLRGFARTLRSALRGTAALDLRMQTNGLLLDDAFCAMLAEESILTSVSLDGDERAHDRHRVRADGSGSHRDVVRAIRRLNAPAHRRAFGGLLCTVDVENDPVAVYRALAGLDPPALDFLLPHATWDRPPPRPRGATGSTGATGATEYADWLIAVHDRWAAEGRPMPIRMFESISRLAEGGTSFTEALGTDGTDLLVLETDGAVEQADWLKTAYPGAPETGLHLATHRLEEAAAHPGIRARRTGTAGLSAACRSCRVVEVCGGGLYGHRYRAANGFDNPSVYCADLLKLIDHVRAAERRPTGTQPAPATATGALRNRHTLPWPRFDALAAGLGTAEDVRELAAAQRSLRTTALAAAARAAERRPDASAAGWKALAALPAEVRRLLLADPHLRSWALSHARLERPAGGRPAEAALSATARTRGRLTLPVPLRRGPEGTGIHLPGLGRLLLPEDGPAPGAGGTVTVEAADGRIALAGRVPGVDPLPGGMRWQPLRHLAADGLRVALDDLDPGRDRYGEDRRAHPRLTEEQAGQWQDRFAEGWRLIREAYPVYAAGIAEGLTTLVPLTPRPGKDISATSGPAFGAIGLALPRTAEDLAMLLIHEFQHTKLWALYDMYDLFDPADTRLLPVPWRPDPRPPPAALQGAYAHLAVADVWRLRAARPRAGPGRDVTGARQARAAAATWRQGVVEVLDALLDTGSLTPYGLRLVRSLREAAAALEP